MGRQRSEGTIFLSSEIQCRSDAFDRTAAHHMTRDAARAAALETKTFEGNERVGMKLDRICYVFSCDGSVLQPLESIGGRNTEGTNKRAAATRRDGELVERRLSAAAIGCEVSPNIPHARSAVIRCSGDLDSIGRPCN